MVGVYFVGKVATSPMVNSKAYANRITVQTSDFETDIKEVDFNNLPLLDKASSQKVGDRVVGQIPDLVSQFAVSDEYSLINYRGSIVRVSPLEYIDFYKWFSNRNGTAGYVMVDTTTGEAQLIRMTQGLKYLPSAYLFNNLNRHVQMHYPFCILGDASFELDESGHPYWIIQTLGYHWINTIPHVNGVIIVDAVTGDMQRYTNDKILNVPVWVDNIYDADIILEEINSWGMYNGGYINSQTMQSGVVQATEGFTYVTHDDDVFTYTGITSIASDESNIGFMMVNMRTHEAKYYEVPGAEEYSAMESAEGSVQEKGYVSTFPLLINLDGRPTYLLSLKDSAGLVKMYGFVDIQNYQKAGVYDASYGIEYAAEQYLIMMNGGTKPSGDDTKDKTLINGVVTIMSMNNVLIDGNTVYYILSTYNERYEVVANVNPAVVPFLKEGDTVEVTYYEADSGLRVVTKIALMQNEPVEPSEPVEDTAEEEVAL